MSAQEAERENDVKANPDLLNWLKDRITLPGFTKNMWTEEHDMFASHFLVYTNVSKLTIYMDKDLGLCMQTLNVASLQKAKHLQYFLKPSEEIELDPSNIGDNIQFGVVTGTAMDSLLQLMQGVYLNTFLQNGTWPESVRKEFSGQLHKFMASLTETTNQVKGHTVLYLPSENIQDHEAASQDKDLVQRLESTLIHWTRQIKEVVNNQETSHHVDNSGPLEEIQFWHSRTVDLSGIRKQLDRQGVVDIVQVLKMANSSYLKPFETLSESIQQGSIEANNNLKFLSTLQGPCEKLSGASPEQIPEILPEILNLIRMIWTISKYYNTVNGLTGLLRKVSNQIIIQCSKKINLNEIFDGDVETSMIQLRESIKCGEAWHEIFDQTVRAIRKDPNCKDWAFATETPSTHGIFAQIDAFVQRCHNLMEVCEGQLQFARKSLKGKTENGRAPLPAFGGSRGSEIEKSLYEIEEAFEKHIDRLRGLDYDVLNVKATGWHHDYNHFKGGLKDLEVMMTNVISSAWEGISTVQGGVELLESFYHLAVRAGMIQTVERKTAELHTKFLGEIKKVRTIFDRHKKAPPLPQGQSRYGGAALWAKSLVMRLDKDMKVLNEAHYLAHTAEADEAAAEYQRVTKMLEGYIRQMHSEWIQTLSSATSEDTPQLADRLNRCLMIKSPDKDMLSRKSTGHLESNFDKQLLRLFSEVRYWDKFHGDYTIPYNAVEMYTNQDTLRVLRESVMLVVRDYNTIIDALSPEERRLFFEHLKQIDRKIAPGLAKLSWSDKHIKKWFVKVCRQKCQEVYTIVLKFKENNQKIRDNCERIANTMLVDIEKNTVYEDVDFERKQARHQERVKHELQQAHADIMKTVQASYEFFNSHPKEIQREWIKFVKKTDQDVKDALTTTVKKSLQELSRAINGDAKSDPHPLFKVNMVLDEVKGAVEFRPTMSELSTMIKQVSKKSITTIQVVPRLTETAIDEALAAAQKTTEGGVKFSGDNKDATPAETDRNSLKVPETQKQESFYDVISNDDDILKILVYGIFHGTSNNVAEELGKIISHYEKHQAIWSVPKDEFIRRFADAKRPLNSFAMEIQHYKSTQEDIQSEDPAHTVNFIRIDCGLLKQSLVNHCQQWQMKLTNLLLHNGKTELDALHEHMVTNTDRLAIRPADLPELATAIKRLENLVGDKAAVEARFEPVEEIFKCLDKFDVHVSDEEKLRLEELRPEWEKFGGTLEKAEERLRVRKEELKRNLESNMLSYGQHVIDTRKDFLELGPFTAPGPGEGDPDVKGAFEFITEYRKHIADNRKKAEDLKKGMDIFGMVQSEYQETEDTEKELNLLEKVWTIMRSYLEDWERWKTGKFSDLNVKELDKTANEYSKSANKVPRSVKQWEVHKSLTGIINRFRQTLPLITNLRSEAMRPRHWEQLQDEIQQQFDPNADDFTLEKVISLGLHRHNEAISTLATVARREMTIENDLANITQIWQNQLLDLVDYKGKYTKVRSLEEINDYLADHSLMLTNMKNSPYFLTFDKDINYWMSTLNEVGETIEMLITVQRGWMYLESIFMDSADIRKQLPAESSLFETVNASWIDLMNKLCVDKKALDVLKDGLLDRLGRMNDTLEKINHSLDQYLEKKRQNFPRFYFLSNDDLLEILGNARDPTQVQKHIRKFFAGVKALELTEHKKSGNQRTYEVVGVRSACTEEMKFNGPVFVEGEVESWLSDVEAMAFETLQKLLFNALVTNKPSHKKAAMEQMVKTTLGQLLITSGQITWTSKCHNALADVAKSKRAVKRLKNEWQDYLSRLSKLVRGDVTKLEQKKLVALITIEVHARDVIDKLKAAVKNKAGVNSFEWLSQLRFEFDKTNGEHGKAVVKQTNTSFWYGYEYQGNNGRLVITPLTDRCYMTLTTALNLCRGGSPQGPAGTGKTETVKDLGKGMAKMVVVFNCSPEMNVQSCARNFSGLSQTGAWGCFDEFNRIVVEVLSVVALQVTAILNAIKTNATTFMLDGREIRLNPTVGIFITMNPAGAGYTGRSKLPDNLASLFRPISMMVPDTQLIAEIMLQSRGFNQAPVLAKKIVTIFDLMVQQLSKQSHYSEGLRTVASVLVRAGVLYKAKGPEDTEELIVMRALKDMNHSKLVEDDMPLFDNLLGDLFPNMDVPALEYKNLRPAIAGQLEKQGLQANKFLIGKCIQLHENQGTRHGNMLVGGTLGGKTSCWKTLAASLSHLTNSGVVQDEFRCVDTYILNPKSVTMDELYGNYDPVSKEWTDGIMSAQMRTACMSETENFKWIILDGPVDTLWIESMNTVLDDNKVLTLVNGDRISMPPQVSLVFEVEDLAVASPATVSRAGIIYLDQTMLTWRPFVASWLQQKHEYLEKYGVGLGPDKGGKQKLLPPLTSDGLMQIPKLIEKYCVPIFAIKELDEVSEVIPILEFNSMIAFTRLFDALALLENGVDPADEANYSRMIEMWFTFCVVWSLGGAADDAGRVRIDQKIRDIEGQYPPLQTVYEYHIDVNKKDWALWEDKVNNAWQPPKGAPFFSIVVPTIDTVRYSFLISALISNNAPLILSGTTGTGKTAYTTMCLNNVDKSMATFILNFSAATSSGSIQQQLEDRLEKRQKKKFGPKGGKSSLVVFVDDLNMPQKDEYGSQPPIELLRQYQDYGFWYDRQKQFMKEILDVQLVGAMGPPGGARSVISARFQSRFNTINFCFPHETQVKRIFRTLIGNHLLDFDESVKPLGPVMTVATVELYKQVVEEFLPTPSCCHYLFNMRDISKVFQGLLQSKNLYYDSKDGMTRLWVHECLRVFSDRLINEEDREKFADIIGSKLNSYFEVSYKKLFPDGNEPLFGDFLEDDSAAALGGDDEDDSLPYIEITNSIEKVRDFMNDKLMEFNDDPDNAKAELVLFDMALHHICRIYRVIKQPRGCAMLVGVGGSGRQSCARLASFMAGMKIVQIQPTKNYRPVDFHEDMKNLFRQAGLEQEPTVFLFSDTQIVHPSFLEDINNILNSGEIPKLFPAEELLPILEELRGEAMKENRPTSNDALYFFLIERVRTNLHVILAMSPVGANFRNYCRMFPALVNCCAIDWFNDWPEDALQAVAEKYLGGIEFESEKQRTGVASCFSVCHMSAVKASSKMLEELKRNNYVTPTKYLDLVQGYCQLLSQMRKKIGSQRDKLENGLTRLDEGKEAVAVMTVELQEKNVVVAQKKDDCEALMVEIDHKKRTADEQKKQVEIDKAKTELEVADVRVQQEDALRDLEKATPALEKAVQALDKLTKSAVTEVKSYSKPPKPVEKVMSAVMVILGKDTTWVSAKKEIGNPEFLNILKNYDKDKMSNSILKHVGKYTKQKDFNADEVRGVSAAAGALCEWVCAMETYAKVYRDVEPKRIALAKAEAKLKTKQDALAHAQALLQEVIDKVTKLENVYNENVADKARYEEEAAMLTDKLQRAADLVEGLSGERVRWEASIKNYTQDIYHLPGDCAIAAAFMSYAGPFTADYRDMLVNKKWNLAVRKNNLPITKSFNFSDFMADPTDVMDWNIDGLPSDAFSTENGVLVTRGMRWPLMIDPQAQANSWIKTKFKETLKVCDFQTPGYMRIIESAVKNGACLLVEDILEDIDPALDSLLRLTTTEKPNSVQMGDKEIAFADTFRMFFTTKLQNPHYKPELAIKVTLINFGVKMQGLEEQLLGIVVRMESVELEREKTKCVQTVAAGKRKIAQLEDSILTLLESAGDNLLDDPELSITLQQSRVTSAEVKQQLAVASETEEKIDIAREAYRPSAIRSSLIYFVLNDLAAVDPMYQFSLASYIRLFILSIEKSAEGKDRESMDVIDRLHAINNYHTEAVYKFTCRALFEKHKLLFAFKLCVEKMKSENKIDLEEYDFFLKGGVVMDRSQRAPNPCPEFLSEVAWDSVTELDKIGAFKGLADSFESNSSEWQAWYRSDDPPPEKLPPPGEWQSKRDDFQQMCVLRCLRPDRVVFAARTFIANNLGQQYTEPPPFDLKAIFGQSTCISPLIFVLSPGVDPIVTLQGLSKNLDAELEILALGQGQTPIALELLKKGVKNGNWVFLANCHLSVAWLPELEKMVERFAIGEQPHPNFRLWLSSDPHPKFPISLLQSSIKITTEPPKGLKANLLRMYTTNLDDEMFERSKKPEKYKKLCFGLCFFHAVMIERKKFLSLGWNIMYDFNDSDWDICENLLQVYLDQYEETPWDALKYLIAQANYGGRVTDDQDRRLLVVYSNQYFCEAALTVPRFQLSAIDKYYIPEDGPRDMYVNYIQTLPDAADDPPEAFGQHANADIASQMAATKTLLDTILALQPRAVAAAGAKTPEETILELVDTLSSQIQAPLDMKKTLRKFQQDKSPLTVVLLQELSRYNGLLNIVHDNLQNVKKGIQGLVVISSELEKVFDSLLNGWVPGGWGKVYPSLKPLGPWTRDLIERVNFFLKWSENGPPKVFWLSAFTFPTGFLTALLQNMARKNAVPIDTLSWDFVVMSTNEQSISSAAKDGAYVTGLFLEGARWDVEAGCLAEPFPMELVCPMPIIQFKPVENKKKGSKGLHATPMYLYPVRTGSRERPSFMIEVDLKSGLRDSQFWTKRGIALLLSLAN